MSVRGRRARLICSALLGALVISCGGPPVYVVAPAPPPAAARAPEAAPAPPRGGLAEAPEPAPEAAPAPAAPPAQVAPPAPRVVPAPAVPPGRPGGAPPGAELVELPGGAGTTLNAWLSSMHSNCKAANYGPNCLNLHISYSPPKGPHKNCTVDKQSPDMDTKVTTSTRITLHVSCEQSEPNNKKSGGSSSTDETGTTRGHHGK